MLFLCIVQVNVLKEKWSKEKNEILTTMKAKIHTEAMEEAGKKFEVARKQIVTELFQMDTARNEAEEKAKTLTESDQEKAEELRRQAEMHHSELDKIRREAQHTDNQHVRNNCYIMAIYIYTITCTHSHVYKHTIAISSILELFSDGGNKE